MSDPAQIGTGYYCPMHSNVRQPQPGKCPKCGMELVPYGTRFALLHHVLGKPMHVAVMAGLMLAVMAAAMMMLR
jgi:Heavy metal binding domain